ncbi:alpha/beta hydrolase [Gordonia sp. CPCC 206044]|uniref:alpha/beta fold hydrolase n=1 Tax=Gordonia sp. CPCC 206044 TaxID=3140793 RepID=UPI003AF3FC55
MVASLTPAGIHISREGVDHSALQLVLVHGAMDSSDSMSKLAAALSEHPVVRYDRRGYGRSAPTRQIAPPSLTDHIDDLRSIVGDTPTVLVGHSLGATISLAVAQALPDQVLGVMGYEPPLPWESWWPAPPLPTKGADTYEVQCAAERFMRRAMGDRRWEELDDARRAHFLSWGPVWAAELRDAGRRRVFSAADLAVPVVVAYGSDSDDRHRRGAAALAGELPGAQLVELTGGTHTAHRRRPDDLARLVHDLVNRVADS